jgi:hypothetical protein
MILCLLKKSKFLLDGYRFLEKESKRVFTEQKDSFSARKNLGRFYGVVTKLTSLKKSLFSQ